ncbi:lipopolysaccharide-induced tumor necrosis factor-alpha factor homolog [Homalodisca vitripennis]|uniref:lipopolysaccharide-induced tumor necrosis factor-alpha factor homolog n=1 Tax=Homalodisca vitripennis TaxID=197043 RepID=UPI001EEB6BA3|nr:lipopolysaccharide-induced tumor necrosis factor-alpha factor homolog [Homalodisca vitripennis]
MASMVAVGPDSCIVTCPSCHATVSTRAVKQTTSRTHLCACILCIFTCCLCAICPYCCDCCKVTNHYCPSCNTFLGTYDH